MLTQKPPTKAELTEMIDGDILRLYDGDKLVGSTHIPTLEKLIDEKLKRTP